MRSEVLAKPTAHATRGGCGTRACAGAANGPSAGVASAVRRAIRIGVSWRAIWTGVSVVTTGQAVSLSAACSMNSLAASAEDFWPNWTFSACWINGYVG